LPRFLARQRDGLSILSESERTMIEVTKQAYFSASFGDTQHFLFHLYSQGRLTESLVHI
jgi:hypothetical protein